MQKNILNLFLFFSIFFYDLAFSFDFNKDGYEDIVFSNNRLNGSYYTDSFIYFGSDLGYSENNKIKLPAIGPHGNTVADINKDGYDDIIFCNYTDGSSYELFSYIYYGNSSGFKGCNLENIPTSGAMGCAVADLNFDGFNDLVFSNYRDNSSRATSSYIYYGSPNGFSTNYRTSLPTIGARGVSIADLNGDSYFDILFSNNNNGYDSILNSVIFFGSESGYSETNKQELPTLGAWGNSIADVNKDGYLDIVFSNYFNTDDAGNPDYLINSYIYLGSSSGYSAENRLELPTIGSIENAIADLNGDGYLDIVFSNHYAGIGSPLHIDSYIYWGSEEGYNENERTYLDTVRAHGVVIADLNGDGKLDIIFSSDASGEGTESIIYWGDENNSYTQKTNLDTNNAWGVSAGQSSAYGKTVAESSSVPEPSLMILLGFGLIFLFKKVK